MTAQGPFQPLLDLATPEIYQRNPFRVLHLSPRATARDAQRALKRREMKGKLGIAASSFVGSQTAAPATEDDLHAAMDRLTHPTARLLEEIFWFWPTAGQAADPVIDAWAQGDIEAARAQWRDQAQGADTGPIALHNLAVLDHQTVLETEATLASTKGLKSVQWADLAGLWDRVFSQWGQVLAAEEFWSGVANRIREIDDAQLTLDLVRPIRDTMPLALLLINGRLAYAAAERGDTPAARRQIELMGKAGLGDSAVQGALAEVIKPLRARIHTLLDQAKARCGETPQRGNRIVRDLHGQVKPLLGIVDCLLAETDFARTGLHDLVAQAIIDGETAYSIKTDDWQEGCALLALAEGIAVAQTVRDKVAENIRQDKENIEQGNHWCSPGYWDLPAPTIEALEVARKKAKAGDFDGAIADLVTMDAVIGTPLQRAFAYAMSIKGIRISNAALDDFNAESGVIKDILDRIRGMPREMAALALIRKPDPHSPSYMNPPCISCGRSHYTSWVNFTYNDIPLFMCSTCNDRHDREVASKKERLRGQFREALECLLLATEMAPPDPGVSRNFKNIKELAGQVNCPIPNTSAIRQRVAPTTNVLRGTAIGSEPLPAGEQCHFCRQDPAAGDCGISVRMSGDIHKVTSLFGTNTQFSYLDVTVPRCRRCHDAHASLPRLVKEWTEAVDAAGADARFPEIVAELSAARAAVTASEQRVQAARRAMTQLTAAQTHALKEAEGRVIEAERVAHAATDAAAARAKALVESVETAKAALVEAQAIGTRCDRCNSDDGWHNHLCIRCDRALFGLGWLGRAAVSLLALLAFGAVAQGLHQIPGVVPFGALGIESVSGWNADEAAQWWPMVAAGLLIPVFAWGVANSFRRIQTWWRQRVQTKRVKRTLVRRQEAIEAAEQDIARTATALADHEAQETQAQAARDGAIAEARAHLDRVRAAGESNEAKARMKRANDTLATAVAEDKSLARDLNIVGRRLRTAKEEAIAAYRKAHPKPGLPPGMAPEDAYTTYQGLAQRQTAGWEIGMIEGSATSYRVSRTKAHVKGLVAS